MSPSVPVLLIAAAFLSLCGCTKPSTTEATGTEAAHHEAAAVAVQPTACTPQDLQLTFDSNSGDFNGMSHTGAYLTLKNNSARTCTAPRRPEVTLIDAHGSALNAKASAPAGMHPGPVLVPLQLHPGATAKSGLRWVSGDVYDGNNCADIVKATVKLDSGELAAPLQSHICGPQNRPMTFEEQWLRTSADTP